MQVVYDDAMQVACYDANFLRDIKCFFTRTFSYNMLARFLSNAHMRVYIKPFTLHLLFTFKSFLVSFGSLV